MKSNRGDEDYWYGPKFAPSRVENALRTKVKVEGKRNG